MQLYKDFFSPEQLMYPTFKRSNQICKSRSHFQKK